MNSAVLFIEILILSFVIFSIFFYLVFLGTLFKHRNSQKMGTPFFKITFFLGISDLFFVFHHFFFWKGPLFGLYPDLIRWGGAMLGRYGFSMIFFGRMGQAFGVALMAANRMVAILKPTQLTTIFTPTRTWIAIITLQLLIPLLYSLATFGCGVSVVSSPNSTSAGYAMEGSCFGPIVQGIAFMFLITSVFVFVSYTIMLGHMLRKPKVAATAARPSASEERKRKSQRNLTLSSAQVGGMLLLNCALMWKICPPGQDHLDPMCALARHGVEMVFSVCNPYVFVLTSGLVREHLLIKLVVGGEAAPSTTAGQRAGPSTSRRVNRA